MSRSRGRSSNLIDTLLLIEELIGVVAVLGVFYLIIPWKLIGFVTSEGNVGVSEFGTIMMEESMTLAHNMPLLMILLLIAVTTYGPQALDLLFGREGPPRR
jgi:hypothetical protein